MLDSGHHYYFPVASASAPSQDQSYTGHFYYDDLSPRSPSIYGDMNYDDNDHEHDISQANFVATFPPIPDYTNADAAISFGGSHLDTASSSSSASLSISNVAQVYDTLHHYACGKQRRSRHDPGGGSSLYGHSETPQVSTHSSSAFHRHTNGVPADRSASRHGPRNAATLSRAATNRVAEELGAIRRRC